MGVSVLNLNLQIRLETLAADSAEVGWAKRAIRQGSLVGSGNLSDRVQRVVTTRRGDVLGKGTILKLDQYAKKSPLADGFLRNIVLSGAPNFRSVENEKVYGVGQPTEFGIGTILNHIRYGGDNTTREGEEGSESGSNREKRVVWINMREEPILYINKRPFVLRELDHPTINMATYSGVTASSVEEMENRLKIDVLKESQNYGGNILVHDEIDGEIIPCWEYISENNVQTPKDVYEARSDQLKYVRLPVTPEQSIRSTQIDEMQDLLADIPDDVHVIFNCQMGLGRSSCGMSIAHMIRYFKNQSSRELLTHKMEEREKTRDEKTKEYMRAGDSEGLTRFSLEEGEYKPVMSFLRLVPNGLRIKRAVDVILSECGSYYIDMKGDIFVMKDRYERAPRSEARMLLGRASNYLERYLLLIVFGAYTVEYNSAKDSGQPSKSFSEWMKERPEVSSLFYDIRNRPEETLKLSHASQQPKPLLLKQSTNSINSLSVGRRGDILNHSMILKSDLYKLELGSDEDGKIDTPRDQGKDHFNLRKISGQNSWGVASCTYKGIKQILGMIVSERLKNDRGTGEKSTKIHWMNLREEPVVYVDNKPYVLRDSAHPFHNLKAYRNIEPSRVETLEDRFKEEVMNEVAFFEGKLYVHDEIGEHKAVGTWLNVKKSNERYDVYTPHEEISNANSAFNDQQKSIQGGIEVNLVYHRLPLAVGKCPTPKDFERLIEALVPLDVNDDVLFSCQMGRARSTVGTTIHSLINLWKNGGKNFPIPPGGIKRRKYEYGSILHIIRVIPEGQKRRTEVDAVIDACGETYNLRGKIDEMREKYERSRTPEEVTYFRKVLLHFVSRYVYIIIINSYLSQQWMEERTEIELFMEEFHSDAEKSIRILKDVDAFDPSVHIVTDNWATPSKEFVSKVVSSRRGDVLDPSTIMKSDHFPGCQKMSILPHLPGAPNFRSVPGMNVYGVAIPTYQGMKNVLDHLNPGAGGNMKKAVWISLREEPVIYINDRPFVLRTLDNLFANLEYTGINTKGVEEMESRLKEDVIRDAKKYGGRFLIHDEGTDGTTIATFEQLTSVLTPREVYGELQKHGYHVDYHRVAVTDEQAPEEKDFDDIVKRVHDGIGGDKDTHIILNCQMGRGRTTTGMVIATLLMSREENIQVEEKEGTSYAGYEGGEYKIILRLIRVLPKGNERKNLMDRCIDKNAQFQNLRSDILQWKTKSEDEKSSENARRSALTRGIGYLKRYFYLIAFSAFVMEGREAGLESKDRLFTQWMSQHQELYSLLDSIDLILTLTNAYAYSPLQLFRLLVVR
ncbi:hypothetical protein PROFUN_03849 [Planoprotostelium fungivorum]|uniref:Paladin-like n=1 Tax=Planoprotostelium fungivorum TaxID=1890364 RepID=A0A2P6NIB9_9EUKA|nr:hypothetical protein PROFUN_03849 [Planoprotostelium fungivorum]